MSTSTNGSVAPTSRYFRITVATWVDAQGQSHAYLTRRILPASSRFAVVQEYTVAAGDRIDNLGSRFIGDPEQFWKLCDANDAMEPEELVAIVGRTLRITLPEGIPAAPGTSGAK